MMASHARAVGKGVCGDWFDGLKWLKSVLEGLMRPSRLMEEATRAANVTDKGRFHKERALSRGVDHE